MASKAPGPCCVVGVKHEGEPAGKLFKVGNIDAYLATPAAGKGHDGVGIFYIPDVIGIWKNAQLMADQYAANGYTTLILDLFNGDAMKLNPPEGFNFMEWLTKGSSGSNPHTKEYVDPIIEEGIKYFRNELGITKIGAVGYCFGAKYVARHYGADKINVGYFAHPSFVDEDELKGFRGPLSIAAAETDEIFPTELRHKSEAILKEKGDPYQIYLYSGVAHGFTVRGDISIKVVKFAKEQAFLQAVAWFNEWLLDDVKGKL